MNFDEHAKKWDTEPRVERAKIIANEIIKTLDSCDNYSAMEFGCGTGLISFNIHHLFKNITLIDSSKGMIDILKTKINEYQVSNMYPYYLDLLNEKDMTERFDVIYHSLVLHHIHNTDAIINTFYKMLNENGYLCIVDLNEEDGSFHKKYPDFDGHNGFNQDDLKNILINAGFKDVKSHTFYNGQKTIEGQTIRYSLFIMTGRKI